MLVHNDLRYLTEDTRAALLSLARVLDAKGLHPKVGWTFRPQWVQDKFYDKSLELIKHGSAPITKTNHSWHTVGRAVDLDISPASIDNIKDYLRFARNFGFHTMYDPDNLKTRLVHGVAVPLLWDWHHLEYRAGRNYETAYNEYEQLHLDPPTSRASFLGQTGLPGFLLLSGTATTALGLVDND